MRSRALDGLQKVDLVPLKRGSAAIPRSEGLHMRPPLTEPIARESELDEPSAE